MPTRKSGRTFYKPTAGKTRLYVKFTLDSMKALFLISFKEA